MPLCIWLPETNPAPLSRVFWNPEYVVRPRVARRSLTDGSRPGALRFRVSGPARMPNPLLRFQPARAAGHHPGAGVALPGVPGAFGAK
jgi:hypothetical protein